jgi:hypothetical protein
MKLSMFCVMKNIISPLQNVANNYFGSWLLVSVKPDNGGRWDDLEGERKEKREEKTQDRREFFQLS